MDPSFDPSLWSDGSETVVRLFPLDVVLLPGGVLPLHIFEPRYREMTRDALADDRRIAMVLPKSHVGPDVPGPVPIHSVACVGEIVNEQELPDGRFLFLLHGLRRVRVEEELVDDRLYRRARASFLDDRVAAHLATRRHLQQADIIRSLHHLLPPEQTLTGQFVDYLKQQCEPSRFADIVTYSSPLSTQLKQEILELQDVDRRLELLSGSLRTAMEESHEGPDFPYDFDGN